IRLNFSARLQGRMPTSPPAAVWVHAIAGAETNPNVMRTPSLRFVLDADKKTTTRIDVSSRVRSDDPTAGGTPNDLAATIKPDEFRRLAGADTVNVVAFGFNLTLRADQIDALHAFARRIKLEPAASR